MKSYRRIAGLTLLATLVACAQGGADTAVDDYAQGAAELSAVQLEVTDDVAAEGLATPADEISAAAGEAVDAAVESVEGLEASAIAPELLHVRAAVRALNQSLRAALRPLAALVREQAASLDPGDVATWTGVRGNTEYRLHVRRGLGKRFGWLLLARPAASTNEFVRVAAGRIAVGAQARRGIGSLGIDLDTLAAIDPSLPSRGKILVAFAHTPRGTTLSYGLRAFTPDAAQHEPFDALLRNVTIADSVRRSRLAYHGDVQGSASSKEELVFARVRQVRGLGGRSDAIAVRGDVPAGQALVISACWSHDLRATFRTVASCPLDGPGGERCTVIDTVGDPSNCPLGLRAIELPPADPMAPMADSDDPNVDVVAPTEMPDGNAAP